MMAVHSVYELRELLLLSFLFHDSILPLKPLGVHIVNDLKLVYHFHVITLKFSFAPVLCEATDEMTFSAAGEQCCLWNRLQPHLCHCDSLGQFKRLLKTHLFGS